MFTIISLTFTVICLLTFQLGNPEYLTQLKDAVEHQQMSITDIIHLRPTHPSDAESEDSDASMFDQDQPVTHEASSPVLTTPCLRRSGRPVKPKRKFGDSSDEESNRRNKLTKLDDKVPVKKSKRPTTNASRLAILSALSSRRTTVIQLKFSSFLKKLS